MRDVNTIYHNEYGMSFQWEKEVSNELKKIQLVFRDTGLLLTREELTNFSEMIKKAINSDIKRSNCKENKESKTILLETPALQVSLAMSYNELFRINDLVKGTLFKMQLEQLCEGLNIETTLNYQ